MKLQEGKRPNVVDIFKGWTKELIRNELEKTAHPFSILCCNIQGDFNIGAIIRNANAFNASHVYIYGRRKWDRRGAVGSHNYTSLSYVSEINELAPLFASHNVVGVDNIAGAVDINEYVWPANPLIIFGEEGCGIPAEILLLLKNVVYIKQFGSVRSLNVGCASAIIMHDWCRKNVKQKS